MIEISCFHCGNRMQFVERIGRKEECPQCHNDVRVCRNCRFYDPKVYNECIETSADVIREKDRANLCEYFSESIQGGGKNTSREDLLSAAEALFKSSSKKDS